MQQALTPGDKIETCPHQSAFHPVGSGPKSPAELWRSSQHRDSGYGSDFSPAGAKTSVRNFTFDDPDEEQLKLCNFLQDAYISSDEEVFIDQPDPVIGVITECDETDEADEEVEILLNQCNSDSAASELDNVRRPSAPLPPTAVDASHKRDLCLIASPSYHTAWRARDSVNRRRSFRPIVCRSVGTQTPNPHCHLVQDALDSNLLTIHRDNLRQGHTFPLPDVVPTARDRSLSLPDVQAFHRREHEQYVGRELRRISDDFLSIYLVKQGQRQRTRSADPSVSSRIGVDLPGYWNSLRRFLSASPLFMVYKKDKH